MPGPAPKPAATRQRRNRSSTAASLPAGGRTGPIPELPQMGRRRWNARTVAWWDAIWHSPMAVEWLIPADLDDLYAIAELKDDYAKLRKPMERVKLLQEIRMQGQRFGLSPVDRRRLQWEVEKGEEASDRTAQRQQQRAASRARRGQADPRQILQAVK